MTDTTHDAATGSNRPTFANPSAPHEALSARDLFGKNFNGAIVELDYKLRARTSKSFFRRDFIYLSRLLYALETYRNIRSIDEAKLDRSEEIVQNKLDAVQTLVKGKQRECAVIREQNAQAFAQAIYPREMTFRAPITSPTAKEYMDVLVAADAMYAELEVCYLLSLIDRKAKTSIEQLVRKAIRSISQTVQQQRAEMAKYVASLRDATTDAESLEVIKSVGGAEAAGVLSDADTDQDTAGSVSTLHDLRTLADEHNKAKAVTENDGDALPTAQSAEPVTAGAS